MTGWAWLHWIGFAAAVGYAVYLFSHVVYSRYSYIRLGRAENSKATTRERLRNLTVQMLGHQTLMKDKRSGWMHLVMFYGFIVLQFGAVDLIVRGLAPEHHLPLGSGYRYFVLVQETTIVLILLAVGYAFYRRYIEKLKRLKRGWKPAVVLIFIAGLMLSLLLTESMRAIWKGESFSAYAPVSSLIAGGAGGIGAGLAEGLFYLFWWLHLLILLAFLVYVPQSKHAHLLFAPFNLWMRTAGPPGKLQPIDLEDETAEEFGVGRIEQFTRNQLLDLYSCVECGRCTNVCPASATGKRLSPMDLIVQLRDHLTHRGAAVTSRTPWMPAFAFAGSEANRAALASRAFGAGSGDAAEADAGAGTGAGAGTVTQGAAAARLIGDVVTEEELWACTTCRNCEDQCPVANEHVSMIVDMRRYLALTEGKFPAEAGRALNHIERQGNPWGLSRRDRNGWMSGLTERDRAPTVEEAGEFDYLFFVGSMGSYDKRSMRITYAMIRIMNEARISFAVLGNEEGNSGDTARRLGNEYLFQELARSNIELFHQYGVTKIITIDPHAYHSFKNEYPDLGLASGIEVYHHTELLARWIAEGRIVPRKELKERVTYHDSCYMGRYNGVYDAPRLILSAIPGVELVEMERSGSNSMCCGAGGGLMWLEEKVGERVNVERTRQALAVRPSIIGSACPYCLTMLGDGAKALGKEEEIDTYDVAELLQMSLEGN
ncbi:(Fe-S)-binding protein [Paenibacillus sp. J2TS4]|uniref:(Fe-S)-binding protein n=1 Tax=Paenibacillus sp. J2TS4 TaxID=2807194 RepID=UPI001BCE55BF|nr:(Fe-S)-binding protein [Paenibacillus sp. J2TS4]